MATNTIREVVGVFHDEPSLQAAVDELLINGFDRASLSLLAGSREVARRLGRSIQRVRDIEDDPEAPRTAYVGPDSRAEGMGAMAGGLAYVGAAASIGVILASGGTAAAALLGAAVVGGLGGLIGAALSRYIGAHHAQYLQDQLNRGGLLLWVRAEDERREALAREILARHAADDIHGHELPGAELAETGGVSYELSFMNRLGL